jgi:S1-C subfamily serine protease
MADRWEPLSSDATETQQIDRPVAEKYGWPPRYEAGPESSEPAPDMWGPPPPPPPTAAPPRRRGRPFLSALLAALLGAGVGTGVTYVALDRNDGTTTLPSRAPVINSNGQSSEAVAAVARAVLPSIVRIDVSEGGFGEGTGSGVIYRPDGYIITNNHVVEDATDIQVTLANGQELAARLVGTASSAGVDIAVLKVDRTGLPAAALGSTTDLEVGDLAVALGSPFGLQGTVTAGVISALHRNITLGAGARFSDAIQTDAPINPGNSGGALATADGKVVGINTAILGGAGGNVGVGFAIPIDIAKKVADQIIATGRASLAFIGISGQNLPDDKGALVQEVVSGGPAARAGIRAGDIIVELGGREIHSMDELIAALIQRQVGETVTVVYERSGDRRSARVRLVARPQSS